MWNKRIVYIALTIICLCSLNGCKSLRDLPQQKKERDLLRSLIDNNQGLTQMEAKCSFQYNNLKVNGLVSVGEKSVYASLQPLLGIESHRVYADQQLIQFVDRGQRVYISDSLQQIPLPLELPISLGVKILRGVLCHQMISPWGTKLLPESCQYSFDEKQQLTLTCQGPYDTEWSYFIDEMGDFTKLNISRKGEAMAQINYVDFENIGSVRVPTGIRFSDPNIRIGDTQMHFGTISIWYKEIYLDRTPKSALTIPSNYSPIDIPILLQSLNLL